MYLISGLYSNIFRLKRALQMVFQVTSEGDTLILKKRSNDICFGDKVTNNGGEGFIVTNKFIEESNTKSNRYRNSR